MSGCVPSWKTDFATNYPSLLPSRGLSATANGLYRTCAGKIVFAYRVVRVCDGGSCGLFEQRLPVGLNYTRGERTDSDGPLRRVTIFVAEGTG